MNQSGFRTCAVSLVATLWVGSGCAPVVRSTVEGPQLKVVSIRGTLGSLPVLRVVDVRSGMVFRVYHDSASAGTARASVQDLADMYGHIASLVAFDPGAVDWAAVVFSRDSAARGPSFSREVRWLIRTDSMGRLTAEGEQMLYVVLPHEQVHAVHSTYGLGLPRWFAEGQATWAGLAVSDRIRPRFAAARRAEHTANRGTGEVGLSSWGSVQPKREAILRQVTPDERTRMQSDPGYAPAGPFTFGPGDFLSDESGMPARYAAALAVFDDLARTPGEERLRAWFRAIWARNESPTTSWLIKSARGMLGRDLTPLVR